MRLPRHKSPLDAFYHLITHVAGHFGHYPLQKPEPCRELIHRIRFYTRVYCCRLVAFEILGSHYHLIVFFRRFRRLPLRKLRRRAQLLYGSRFTLVTRHWTAADWEKFNHKLFDLSAFMHHLNGEYAKWYNQEYNRRGHFWAGRFKNTELLDARAVQNCLFYVELNALKAGMVKRAGQWKGGSAWARMQGRDRDLMPIEKLFDGGPKQAFEAWRQQLVLQGLMISRWRQGRVLGSQEAEAELSTALWRERFWTDGIAVGGREEVEQVLRDYRQQGLFTRRCRATRQPGQHTYSLREQRSHARW
ncbi:MAG: hypothetical protein JSU96_06000 [Acidobacteriota bacterium]|nr:MAG: hypothetical protein JSU96_06000 [Acidobacteriota bacterium]